MSKRNSDPKAPLPGWIRPLIVVAGLGVLGAAVFLLLTGASTARWNRYAASLRAGGVPLTFDEIDALRVEIPDEENGALILERLRPQLENFPPSGWKLDRAVLIFGDDGARTAFFDGLPRYRVDASREFLNQHTDLLEALSRLSDTPTGRFEIPIDANANVLAMTSPIMSPLRNAAKLLSLDGFIRLADGDLVGAACSVRLQAQISATLNEHPTVIGRLVQIAIEALAVARIEDILRVGELDRKTLLDLTDIVDSWITSGTMKWAFLGERAFFVRVCEDMVAGKLSMSEIIVVGASVPPFLPDILIRENQMRGVEMLTWLVDAADDPDAMTKAAARIGKEARKLPVTQALVRVLLPSMSRAVTLHLMLQAELLCAKVALSAERFRLATGRLPTSLAELVPDYLEAVPSDPFDGQPMRFAVTDKGIVVYSIGEDLVDDGGIVGRQDKRPYFRDNGFRLFTPQQRGLLLTDEPRPEED